MSAREQLYHWEFGSYYCALGGGGITCCTCAQGRVENETGLLWIYRIITKVHTLPKYELHWYWSRPLPPQPLNANGTESFFFYYGLQPNAQVEQVKSCGAMWEGIIHTHHACNRKTQQRLPKRAEFWKTKKGIDVLDVQTSCCENVLSLCYQSHYQVP